MTERMNIVVGRQYTDNAGETKVAWSKIGAAFKGEKGWQLQFDALPVPNAKGKVTAYLFPPDPPKQKAQSNAQADDDLGDSIPF